MKKLISLILFLLMSIPSLFAGDFIPHSVGVMISQKGYQGVSNNIQDLLFINGISPDSFYLENINMQTEEGPLESLVEGQPEIYDLVKTWREYLQRILVGVNLDSHQFVLEANNLEATVEWDQIDVSFQAAKEVLGKDKAGLVLNLKARAKNLAFTVDKVRGYDLANPFLGDAGFNGVSVHMDQSTGPLALTAQIHLQKDSGNFKAQVMPIQWNWKDIALTATYDRPLIFPKVQILINDHPIDVNVEELDNIFKEKLPQLLTKASEAIEAYIQGQGLSSANELISDGISSGISETNFMAPPGAPNAQVKPFNWGLHVDHLAMRDDSVFLNLSGFARDGNNVEKLYLSSIKSAKGPFKHNPAIMKKHDAAIAINQGLINQVIKLSAKRGYFDSIEAGEETIKLASSPIFDLTGSYPKVTVEIEHTVTGLSAAFVRNPIRLNLDLVVDFPVENGKSKIVAKGVDLNSVHLDDKYIRLFKNEVQMAVRKKVAKMGAGLIGYPLADELPVPSTLAGIGLVIKKIEIDRSGHLVIYHDFDWSLITGE